MNYRDNASPSEAQVWFEKALARIEEENSAYIESLEKDILSRIYAYMSSQKSLDKEVQFPFFVDASNRRTYEREELAMNKAIKNLNQAGWSISRLKKEDKSALRVDIKLIDS